MQNGKGADLLAFLDRIGNHGEINPATARALQAAVRLVLSVDPDPEGVDVRGIDVNNMLERFENLNRARLRDDSLRAYRSRFRRAVAMYIAWLDKDSGWKSAGKSLKKATNGGTRRPGRVRRSSRPAEPEESTQSSEVNTVAAAEAVLRSTAATRVIAYDVPIRPNLLVRISLPIDLTAAEARRAARFIESLAFDETTGGASRDDAGKPSTEED
jgi:hypothetical protein